MKRGAFGFSRKELTWFAVILLVSFSLLIFCGARIVTKHYRYSNESSQKIKGYSADLLNLQEITMGAVNMQRSALNLIIYADNHAEMSNINASLERQRDIVMQHLLLLKNKTELRPDLLQKIEKAGYDYISLNTSFRKLIEDSIRKEDPANFNMQHMRPALRVLTDLTRQTSRLLTQEIQVVSESKLNIFTMYEFWLMIAIALPYLYFFFRFINLFIKVLFLDSDI